MCNMYRYVSHIILGSKDLVVPRKVQYLRWRNGPAKGPWGLQAAPLNKEGIIHIILYIYIYDICLSLFSPREHCQRYDFQLADAT